MLRIQHYRKAYEDIPVLAIEDLRLEDSVYWLKGENGSGKTTFLKSIAGLTPFAGTIEVDNINLRKQRKLYTKCVSIADAEPVYPPFLTGEELLKFYQQTKGCNRKAQDRMTEMLGISGYLRKEVGTYSSGMLKKLSLLLAFTGSPKWILLDEPLITLDVAAVDALRNCISTAAAQGVSFLISSHQELELRQECHRLHIRQQTIEREAYVSRPR